jgi:hypothetical protein
MIVVQRLRVHVAESIGRLGECLKGEVTINRPASAHTSGRKLQRPPGSLVRFSPCRQVKVHLSVGVLVYSESVRCHYRHAQEVQRLDNTLRYIDPAGALISRDYLQQIADRMQVARIFAGRITAEDLAAAISRRGPDSWSRAKVANVESARKRVTLSDVQLIAETLSGDYGLTFVSVDWLMGEGPDPLQARPE